MRRWKAPLTGSLERPPYDGFTTTLNVQTWGRVFQHSAPHRVIGARGLGLLRRSESVWYLRPMRLFREKPCV